MKLNKTFTPLIVILCLSLILVSCESKDKKKNSLIGNSSDQGYTQGAGNQGSNSPDNQKQESSSLTHGSQENINQELPKDEYPYDVAKHRKNFPKKKVDLVFKDNNYVSLINDCFINPRDYVGKSVEIEGFYIWDGFRTYVGRKGPTCPYCTAGYVGIEFHGDDKSVINSPPANASTTPPNDVFVPETKNPDSQYDRFVIGETWIKVRGYVRQGKDPTSGLSFTYIEAISVEVLPEKGTETVK